MTAKKRSKKTNADADSDSPTPAMNNKSYSNNTQIFLIYINSVNDFDARQTNVSSHATEE